MYLPNANLYSNLIKKYKWCLCRCFCFTCHGIQYLPKNYILIYCLKNSQLFQITLNNTE